MSSGFATPPGNVNCGGHFAANCGACTHGNGAAWCNGDCLWTGSLLGDGECKLSSPILGMPSLEPQDSLSSLYWWGLICLLSSLVMLVYACIYKRKVIAELEPIPSSMNITGDEIPVTACCKKPHTILYTCFCMPIVLGKNYWAASLMPFWPGCIFSFLLHCTPLYPLGVCVRAILAKKVQDIIGHDRSWATVFFLSLFCLPCEVGRESLEVDAEIGADITCCCQVEVTSRLMSEMANVKSRMCTAG